MGRHRQVYLGVNNYDVFMWLEEESGIPFARVWSEGAGLKKYVYRFAYDGLLSVLLLCSSSGRSYE
jgi:hypothetical protein